MNKITKALKSRTFWTVVLMFIIGGTEAVTGYIPAGIETPLLGALGLAATYFKLNPSQPY